MKILPLVDNGSISPKTDGRDRRDRWYNAFSNVKPERDVTDRADDDDQPECSEPDSGPLERSIVGDTRVSVASRPPPVTTVNGPAPVAQRNRAAAF